MSELKRIMNAARKCRTQNQRHRLDEVARKLWLAGKIEDHTYGYVAGYFSGMIAGKFNLDD